MNRVNVLNITQIVRSPVNLCKIKVVLEDGSTQIFALERFMLLKGYFPVVCSLEKEVRRRFYDWGVTRDSHLKCYFIDNAGNEVLISKCDSFVNQLVFNGNIKELVVKVLYTDWYSDDEDEDDWWYGWY